MVKNPKKLLGKCLCAECDFIREALRSAVRADPTLPGSKIEKLSHAELDSMVVARGRIPKVSN